MQSNFNLVKSPVTRKKSTDRRQLIERSCWSLQSRISKVRLSIASYLTTLVILLSFFTSKTCLMHLIAIRLLRYIVPYAHYKKLSMLAIEQTIQTENWDLIKCRMRGLPHSQWGNSPVLCAIAAELTLTKVKLINYILTMQIVVLYEPELNLTAREMKWPKCCQVQRGPI